MSVIKKESGLFFKQLCGEFSAESCLHEKVDVSGVFIEASRWEEGIDFLSKIKDGDEIRRFNTPPSSLDMRGGYALVRDGKVVEVLTTILS